MRPEPNIRVDSFRRVHPTLGASDAGANWGYFTVPVGRQILRVISSGTSDGWEHVSVSLAGRCPTWQEMQAVKELFWDEEETVLQYHPKKSVYVNQHPHCLHLWKRVGVDAILPPLEFV